jgi:ribosome recycling factor
VIRVPIPDLSEERRKDLGKKANEYGENAKISVRNIRRDGNDHFKKLEKEKMMSEDESRSFSDEIQKITEEYTKKIDQTVSDKVKEIMTI